MTSQKLHPLFLGQFGNLYGALPFDRLQTEDYLPALHQAIAEARLRLGRLRDSSEPPDFENTVRVLETLSENLDLLVEVYFNLLSAEADEAFHAVAKDFSPLVAEVSNDVVLDEKVFARVRTVHEKRARLGLTTEERRVTEKTFRNFVRNGALLSAASKARLREIDAELARLSPAFSQNVLKATYDRCVEVTDESRLKGIPLSAVEAARTLAQSRKKETTWSFSLESPSYVAVMSYAQDRALRQEMAFAYRSRSFGGPFDNQTILKQMARLRFERARLLGFKTHADYVLEERMAQETSTVRHFLQRIQSAARPRAEKELSELRKFAREIDHLEDFQSWDVAYYAEKLKEKKFHFSEEELRPYFLLENVIQGVFSHAAQLFDLEFVPAKKVPVYHPEVTVYEVRDRVKKRYLGLLYLDFFPRPTKRGGAWMTAFREQGLFKGVIRRPHISIVCNFTKPSASQPSLLTLEEVRTLFHEFGHALHGLLSDCTYRSVAGTNVYWDFVELPSQLMENWVLEEDVLERFAVHYETQKPMPRELARKVKQASQFHAAIQSLRQVSLSLLDLGWHATDPTQIEDVDAYEREVTASTMVLPPMPGTNVSTSFGHIFAGGYSAGYYSYKWAEVLDADAFELFQEKGLYSPEVAQSLRTHILSKGGTEHPMELYKRFRGREPDPDALLRRDGLLDAERGSHG